MTGDGSTDPESTIEVNLPGAIQFAYDLQAPESVVADALLFGQLAAWGTIFARLGFVGQVPGRYGNASFGNLSVRDPDRTTEFVITANQSGAAPELDQEQITRVVGCSLERFWVDAIGVAPPSSETLTHAAIYAADPRIEWVFHIRSAEISEAAGRLAIPATDAALTGGTPELARAVHALLDAYQSRPLVFVVPGQEDAVLACGPTARDTGGLLVSYLARSLSP